MSSGSSLFLKTIVGGSAVPSTQIVTRMVIFSFVLLSCKCWHLVRIRSHDSNTTQNSGEFPRYVYLFVIRFPETPEFPMFSIFGKLWNSDVSNFRKLRTPTFSEIFVLCNSPCFMSSVTFGSDRIRTYRGRDEKPSPVDSYWLSSPERVPEERRLEQRRYKTAGAEPEDPSVPKNLRQRRGRSNTGDKYWFTDQVNVD